MKLTAKTIIQTIIAVTASIVFISSATAEEQQGRAYDEIEFTEGAPGIHFGLLWGDWSNGPFSMIVKIESGAKAPDHHHGANYNAVSIQGTWVHTTVDGVEHVITPGSYAHQPAQEVHGDRCRGPEDCIILVQMDGPNTFVIAE